MREHKPRVLGEAGFTAVEAAGRGHRLRTATPPSLSPPVYVRRRGEGMVSEANLTGCGAALLTPLIPTEQVRGPKAHARWAPPSPTRMAEGAFSAGFLSSVAALDL